MKKFVKFMLELCCCLAFVGSFCLITTIMRRLNIKIPNALVNLVTRWKTIKEVSSALKLFGINPAGITLICQQLAAGMVLTAL